LTGAAICVGWSVVVLALTPARLYDSLVFSRFSLDSDGWRQRLAFAHDTFAANLTFSTLCVTAIAIGVTRRAFPQAAQLATMAVIASLFALTPTLYARSHDAVTLAAFTGLGLLSGLRTNADRAERVIGMVYGVSLVAALTISGTAYYSFFNFSIGAMPAAALAIADGPAKRFNFASAPSILALLAAVFSTSLFFYYGELPGQPVSPRERMAGGFFSGLALIPNDAALVRLVQSRIEPLLDKNQSVVLIGRLPGMALAMPTRLSMLSSYPIPSGLERLLAKSQAFYEEPGRLPSLVLIYRDAYFAPSNPILHFNDQYAPTTELKTPLGSVLIFRRR
jgi:hypothetical protein